MQQKQHRQWTMHPPHRTPTTVLTKQTAWLRIIRYYAVMLIPPKRATSLLISLLLVTLFTACVSSTAGLAELKRLCEKDAGLKIYKTVEAEGYYNTYSNSGITESLIKGSYRYYEFCDDSPSLSRNTFFPEPGCFRVERVDRNTGNCYQRIDDRLSQYIVEPYPEFLKDNCIAVEKLVKPEAQYSYHSDFKFWAAKNDVSEFTRSDVYIKDDLTDEILGRDVSYSYNTRPGHTTAKSCEIFEGDYPSYTDAKFISTVLKPVSKRKQP